MPELECLAVVYAFRKFRHYLLGAKVTLFTDHSALRQILGGKRDLSGKFARWALTLSEYVFTVKHVPREQNRVADFLTQGQFRERKPRNEDPSEGFDLEPSFL